jgi:hypothetical protein
MSFRPRTLSTAWRGEQGGDGQRIAAPDDKYFKDLSFVRLRCFPPGQFFFELALGPMVEFLIFALRFA